MQTRKFPNSFYIEVPKFESAFTSEVTGLLGNPLDFEKPWLTLEQKYTQDPDKKKTLVFADHFFIKDQNKKKNTFQNDY